MIVRLASRNIPYLKGYQTIEWPWPTPPRVGDFVSWYAPFGRSPAGRVWRVDWCVSDGNQCVIVHLKPEVVAAVDADSPDEDRS